MLVDQMSSSRIGKLFFGTRFLNLDPMLFEGRLSHTDAKLSALRFFGKRTNVLPRAAPNSLSEMPANSMITPSPASAGAIKWLKVEVSKRVEHRIE